MALKYHEWLVLGGGVVFGALRKLRKYYSPAVAIVSDELLRAYDCGVASEGTLTPCRLGLQTALPPLILTPLMGRGAGDTTTLFILLPRGSGGGGMAPPPPRPPRPLPLLPPLPSSCVVRR